MKGNNIKNDNSFIQYNSLITLSIISEEDENSNYTKYLLTDENLDYSLSFKLCKKPLIEYSNLISSYFYIRNIDECISNFGISDNKNKKNEGKMGKELNYISKEKIHQNNNFYLQHMMSKQFISVERTKDNLFILKLLNNIDNAAIFTFRKINEKRNSNNFISAKEIYYLSLYIKEDNLYYYVHDDKKPINQKYNNNYNILISKKQITHFMITLQNWNISDSNNIYSGQLINIIFSNIKDNREEKLMLSAEKKEKKNPILDISNYDNEICNNSNINKEYRIIGIPYTEYLCDQTLNNSFWAIEENLEVNNFINKHPIKIKEYIRIKNVITGLYLSIRKKGYYNNSNASENEDMSGFFRENKDFEFILVDENKLNEKVYLEYNFLLYNYVLDNLKFEVVDEGKYIIKGVFRKLNLSLKIDLKFYYQSIGLTINDKNNLIIKNENDFVFKLKKIDIFKGIQINYIIKKIDILNKEINDDKLNDNNIYNIKINSKINESIIFFQEFLLNINYSFRDENYEYNFPIKERQVLLYKYNIVESITTLIDIYLNIFDKNGNFLTEKIRDFLNELLINIIKFFKFLSISNEEIKQAIYIISLNKLLKISEIIFEEDKTILIDLIFDLIQDSEALQDYLLGGGGLLKQQILKNPKLYNYNICDLFRENKLLEYIEKNYNYLFFYEKLIELNKVQYKRKEIISQVEKHIEEVKNNNNPCIKNYKQIIYNIVAEVLMYIKKHAILLERFKNEEKINVGNFKKRRTSFGKKQTIKENIIKKNNEENLKRRKTRMNTVLGSNTSLIDSSRNTTLKLLSEKSKSNKNCNINNKNYEKDNNNQVLKNIFTFNSINSLNENDNNIKNAFTNETSEFLRLLKENNEDNIEKRKSYKSKNNNIFSNIIKRRTKKLKNIKTSKIDFERKETIKSDNIEPYQKYLNKLGKILVFIKFFIEFDLEKSLFIQDIFLNEAFQNTLKNEDYENPLYIFFIGNSKKKNCLFGSKSLILYLFHLYNMIFPNIKSKLQNKIQKNINISGTDIFEEIENNNIDNFDTNIEDDIKYKQELKEDFETLDEYLYILYSIYQFCINQYVKIVDKFFHLTSNFTLNYVDVEELKKIRVCFKDTIKNLLSKVTFIKDENIEILYSKIIENPTLITNNFNFINPNQNSKESSKKIKKKNHKKKFSKREINLIQSLFFFAKRCDKIKYSYVKIIIFKYIKNLLNDEKCEKYKLTVGYDSIIENQLSNILQILNNHKTKILNSYEILINTKKKHSSILNLNSIDNIKKQQKAIIEEGDESDVYEVFKVREITEIIIRLLRKYDIEKFFNNIIYIESTETYMNTDKIVRKIRKMREHLYQIEKEIHMMKINIGKNTNLKENCNKSFCFGDSNKKSFININRHLSQICDESGNLFNFNEILNKRTDKLALLLSMENKSFYKKIKICKVFKYMIEALNYYEGENDQNILIYCIYLLKIINNLKNIESDYHKNIEKNYKLYEILLLKSLKCISTYPINEIGEKEQCLFLNICFYGIEVFLLILKYSKLCFNTTKDFIENIFFELQIIFEQYLNKKYKIIYQILYTYAVTRILLILNKKKTYDSYSYDMFFKFIYPIDKMRKNILLCVEIINNNSNKEHIISRKNSNIFFDNKYSSNEQDDDNDDEASSLYIPDDEKGPLIINEHIPIIPMDLSKFNMNMNLIESKYTEEKTTKINDKEEEKEKYWEEDFIKWDKDEFNRLSFYLNFLSVYVIYLNDKNSLLEEKSNELLINEKNEDEEKFSFNILSSKINNLLDNHYNYSNNKNPNNLISYQNESTLIKEEQYFNENYGPKNMEYKFHSALLESILKYRAMLGKKKVEIKVRKAKIKNNDDDNDNDSLNEYKKTETQNTEMSMFNDILNNNTNIIFYYYDKEYIDIILLEKILSAIELKEDLMNYCIEEYHNIKQNPEIFDNLLIIKKNYQMIQSYYDEEYNLIHDSFIKNNMGLLIKKLLKSFNSNDLIEIEGMENYITKTMGEIYIDIDIKMNNECLQKENSLVDFLIINENNLILNMSEINLLCFFDFLVYLYPKYKKTICIIYYNIGFKLLAERCNEELLSNDKIELPHSTNKKIDLESITKILILLLSRETNRELIEHKKVFMTILNNIRVYFSYIILRGGGFIIKNVELLKELFHKLDFIFEYLSKDFEKIVKFLKKSTNTKDIDKYIKKRNKLENLLDFLIIFLEFKKVTEENILTDEIMKFTGKIVEKVIKLLFFLLELPNNENLELSDILIDFLFSFIKGPDITNLNLLFSLGFFDLMTFVIKDIDYYRLFLNYLNKDNMHEIIDNVSGIECKIIKIFIIYYNLSHGNYNNSIIEFEKLQQWYEENFKYIRQKLKRLYYISEKEMKDREYNINKMLLFMRAYDDYDENELKYRAGKFVSLGELDSLSIIYTNRDRRNYKKQNIENDNSFYCIIKFDLLLAYYSLYNYHKDLSFKEIDCHLYHLTSNNKSAFYNTIIFFKDFSLLIIRILFVFLYIVNYIFRITSKKKKDAELLQEIKNIDIQSQLIEEQKMINYLRIHIRELEITIKNNIYKIYFPMIDKANAIEEFKEEYYNIEKIDSSEFINYLLSNYDAINIRAKQYVRINNIIKIPIINILFKNIYIYAILLIALGLISNLLIMLSFSTFVENNCGNINFPNASEEIKIQCPHFLYKEKNIDKNVKRALDGLGITELILQCIIFIDYIVRMFLVEKSLLELKYRIKKLSKNDNHNYTFTKIFIIIYRCIINFRSLYYLLSISFIILGLKIHPFFNCITLLEFVNRIQLMQTVLKAMYKPLKNILITLLMFLILEYFFSLFAISFFTTHFPNPTDTKNFLKTFMRMIDQTFKQDGGIGTYLDKSLDKNYYPYIAPAYFNLRFFFDLLFFLLILLLIFQMFLSTIIDYFNETRENTQDFQEGLETHCLVCGLEREKIEKIYSHEKLAFDKHINYYHYCFNYIYYLMYLHLCLSRDSIIENSIWNLHLKKNLSYLPKNICFKQLEKKCWKRLNQKKNEDGEEN